MLLPSEVHPAAESADPADPTAEAIPTSGDDIETAPEPHAAGHDADRADPMDQVTGGPGIDLAQIFDDQPHPAPGMFTGQAITVFTPETGDGALYLNGALHQTGSTPDLLAEALVLTGATLISSDEHRLGDDDGPAARTLDDITAYHECVEHAADLRAQAEALLTQANEVDERIAEMTIR